MKKFYCAVALVALVVGMFVGCNGQSGSGVIMSPGMTYRTYDKEENPIAFDVSVKDGKLTWAVDLKNSGDRRVYCAGIISLRTDVNALVRVEFGCTVEAGTKVVTVGEKDKVVPGMPKDWKILSKNIVLIPGAGCETPTTHVAGNWPATPLSVEYKAELCKTETKVIDPIDLVLSTTQVDMEAKEFTWTVRVTNKHTKKVTVDLVIECLEEAQDGSTVVNKGVQQTRSFDETVVVEPGKAKDVSGKMLFDQGISKGNAFRARVKTTRISGLL